MIDVLRLVGLMLVVTCALTAWAFVMLYFPVRGKGPEGWHMWRTSWWLALAFSIMTVQPFLRIQYPEVFYPVAIIVVGGVAVEMVLRLVLLLGHRRDARLEREAKQRELDSKRESDDAAVQ